MPKLPKIMNLISKKQNNLSRDELESILNCMSDGLIVYNLNYDIIFMNPAMAQLLIPSNPAATGRLIKNPDDKILFERCVNIDKIKEIQQAIEKSPDLPRCDIIELRNPKQVLKRYTSPLYNKSGKQTGYVIIYHDITSEVTNEKLRTEFIATASHELRTPVTAIKALLESLKDGAKDDPKLKEEFFNDIEIEVDRLHHLVNNLLDLSRYESGQEKLNLDKVELKKVVQDALNTVYPLAKQRNIKLIVDIDKIKTLGSITADKLRLHQILVNLLTNGIKFTPKGGTVGINIDKKDGFTEFQVYDTGIGIPNEAIPHIFDKFFRVERPGYQTIRGSGLGLTIVKHAVNMHKGNIYIQSQPGNTVVTFTIPDFKESVLHN